MKFIKVFFLFSLFLVSSCSSIVHDRLQTGTIVRNCSGTYVKTASDGNYLICNTDIVKDKKEGEKISFVYDFDKNCPERDGEIRCMLYFEHKGNIKIKTLK